jgi:hypothetical protein
VISDQDVYSVPCPDCGAEPEQPCVYVPVRGVDMEFLHYRSAKVRARVLLTGTPTKRPHNGRINAALHVAQRRANAARLKALRAAGRAAEASPLRRQIARIEAEFDRREYEQMRAWLAEFGGILTNAGR